MRPCLNWDKFPSWLYHGTGCTSGTARGAAHTLQQVPARVPAAALGPFLFPPPPRGYGPRLCQFSPLHSCTLNGAATWSKWKKKKKSKIVGEKWNSGECNFFKPQLMSHIWLPAGPHKQLDWHILGGCWCLVRGNLKASLLQGSIRDPQLKPC